jgi:hypothetical protein
MKPAQQPPSRNTRLAVIARNTLKTILSDEKVADIEKQVEAGQLTLAELDDIAETGGNKGFGAELGIRLYNYKCSSNQAGVSSQAWMACSSI